MEYITTFLEGIISFISPCMLPMLPLYLSYFAAGADSKRGSMPKIISFVAGFTIVFCLLGLFAGFLSSYLVKYKTIVNVISGLIVIIFGLGFMEIIRLPFFKGMKAGGNVSSVISAFLFGVVFSVNLSPCTGAFLGSALMMASSSGTAFKGVMLLLCYSLGLGIPFVISAVLADRLAGVFSAIKSHYRIINIVCGMFLIVIGVVMMTGLMNRLIGGFI